MSADLIPSSHHSEKRVDSEAEVNDKIHASQQDYEQADADGSESNSEENPLSQITIDKYSNELNSALLSSSVSEVIRLCQLPFVRSYAPYHLNQLELVLMSGHLTGTAQEQCWTALSTAWPESIDANLSALTRAAVTGGPLSALQSLILKIKQNSVSSRHETHGRQYNEVS